MSSQVNLVIADQRLAAGLADVASFTNEDQNGNPVDAGGAVTVTITRSSDGTTLVTGGATVHDAATPGVYTYALTAAQTASLDVLNAAWSVAGGGTFNTIVEIVGGYYFSIAEARNHPALVNQDKYPTADLVRARTEVEQEAELICDRAFVPRFRRVVLNGRGETTLHLPSNDLRSIVAVSVDGVAFTAGQLAAIILQDHQVIEQPTTDLWEPGRQNIVICWTYGLDRPPPDFKRAALARFREVLNLGKRGIPARAKTFHPDGAGGSYDLTKADTWETGNEEVDPVYGRWSMRAGEDASGHDVGGAKSVSMDMNPLYGSLFHGGIR